jgi:predicted transcriptional regulator
MTCLPAQVLEKMVFNSVHRVYITDDRQRPLGVVTMSGVRCC